ncbi:MAG: Ig-like domain repeat protein [Solirubrobacterales bacterium]
MSRRYTAWLVAAVTAFGTIAASASAGTFTVSPPQCGQWSGGDSNGWGGGISCINGYTAFQLSTGSGLTVGPPGTFMWLKSVRLNDATYLSSLSLEYIASQATGSGDHIQVRGCQRYTGPTSVWSAGPNGTCVGAVMSFPNQTSAFAWRTFGAGTLGCGTNCGGYQIDVSGSHSSGHVWISGVSAQITDNTAPTTTSALATHEISQGNWMNGSVEIGATGHDPNGSGITDVTFYPGDPLLSVSDAKTCNYAQWVPCTLDIGTTGSFNTAALADGSHTGYYTSTDAGGNTGQSSSFTYKTDNTEPATPTGIGSATNGEGGWSSNNLIGAAWTNGPEVGETATQSGLDTVIVDVNPTTGSQINPAPIAVPIGGSAAGVSATASSISGLVLPAAGAWTLRLQLVDKAGNVSDVGDGTGSSVDSDISVGFDPNPPATPQGQANGWISRDELAAGFDQEFTYSAPPQAVAPVCGFAGAIDKNPNGTAGSSINVPGGGKVRAWQLPGTLDEDTHYVHLRAVGCNGVASLTTETVTAPVDRTDPVGTISGVENGKWYTNGRLAELRGIDVLSGMAPAPPIDDTSTKGAYLAYSINGSGPLDKDAPRGDSTSIPITGEGQKELRFSPVDLAGNKAAAKVTTFGIDATHPYGYINDQSAARPTLLSSTLTDAPSGVSYAVFSVRSVGGSDADWIQLPTSLAGVDGNVVGTAVSSGTATARFPDTSLPQGTYDVRIRAFDLAGNPLSTQRYQDGSLARVENPMRAASSISIKLFKALRECKRNKHGKMKCAIKKCTRKAKGTCYRVLRGKVVLQGGSTAVTSAYNRGAIATGVLTDASGAALKYADVSVSTATKVNGKYAAVGVATTDATGIWAIRVPAGVNRSVKVTYEGTETRRPSTSSATMNTQAKLKLKVNKKRAATGQSITFSGKVTPYDGGYPSGGKIVALQFFAAKKWRPAVGVAHSDQYGKFKIRYKFDGRKVRAKIIFRVIAPSEDAWGHSFSSSKPISVKLNY